MSDLQLRHFLLRQLASDQAARVEDAILLEEGFAERLREAEFDLLDDYAHSRLDTAEAAAVERHLLGSEENRRSVQIARALRERRATPEPGATLARRAPEASGVPLAQAMLPATSSRRRPRASGVGCKLAGCLRHCHCGHSAMATGRRGRQLRYRFVQSGVAYRADVGTRAPRAPLRTVSLLADVNRGAARPSIAVAAGGDLGAPAGGGHGGQHRTRCYATLYRGRGRAPALRCVGARGSDGRSVPLCRGGGACGGARTGRAHGGAGEVGGGGWVGRPAFRWQADRCGRFGRHKNKFFRTWRDVSVIRITSSKPAIKRGGGVGDASTESSNSARRYRHGLDLAALRVGRPGVRAIARSPAVGLGRRDCGRCQ
jgi:hypothetical protein